MTRARDIIEDCLSFALNRLSPGESADSDTLATCLRALNSIVDQFNGSGSFLFREILTPSAAPISTVSATLGSNWPALTPGEQILGATYRQGSSDYSMSELTFMQYHEQVVQKTQTGQPEYWAHDGLATVFFYPVPLSYVITLRTKAEVAEFADVDTDYSMPSGYRSAFSALLAEKLSPVMLGGVTAAVKADANDARMRLLAMNCKPAIIGIPPRRGNIITGF